MKSVKINKYLSKLLIRELKPVVGLVLNLGREIIKSNTPIDYTKTQTGLLVATGTIDKIHQSCKKMEAMVGRGVVHTIFDQHHFKEITNLRNMIDHNYTKVKPQEVKEMIDKIIFAKSAKLIRVFWDAVKTAPPEKNSERKILNELISDYFIIAKEYRRIINGQTIGRKSTCKPDEDIAILKQKHFKKNNKELKMINI